MKLRDKETGENYETTMPIVFNIKTSGGGEHTVSCESITELNEKWEDVPEEPKEYWAIDCFSPDGELVSQFGKCSERIIENRKQIGNHFKSKEEAEKAVEKLKAFKRLEDKGFRFDGIDFSHRTIKFKVPSSFFDGEENIFVSEQSNTDLRFLFGGEG